MGGWSRTLGSRKCIRCGLWTLIWGFVYLATNVGIGVGKSLGTIAVSGDRGIMDMIDYALLVRH